MLTAKHGRAVGVGLRPLAAELVEAIDAVRCGKPPGTIVKIEGDEVPAIFRKKISPHQLGISDLLAVARLTDMLPKKVVLFGIEPKELGAGLELSREVGAILAELAVLVALELAEHGVQVKPRMDRWNYGGVVRHRREHGRLAGHKSQ